MNSKPCINILSNVNVGWVEEAYEGVAIFTARRHVVYIALIYILSSSIVLSIIKCQIKSTYIQIIKIRCRVYDAKWKEDQKEDG